MFDKEVYIRRREKLREILEEGIVLLLGNDESPMNYPANPYHFRQDSNFLYFFGLDEPGLAGVIDLEEEDSDILFGDDLDVEDIIWMGYFPPLKEKAEKVGVKKTFPSAKLSDYLREALSKGRRIHFLPPYRGEHLLKLAHLLGIRPEAVKYWVSVDLIRAVVELRSFKEPEEIQQMDMAANITAEMHLRAMKNARAGMYERELAGEIEGLAISLGGYISFPVILTVHGEILHNHYHENMLREGQLLLVDAGAESPLHYAGDMTRTFPVSARFTTKQREIYEVVLSAQKKAIENIKPGVYYRDVHLLAAKTIAEGLKALGLMKGDVEEAVAAGAHALFFPHGLGHMIGLDVHDMEGLGEDYVGYDETVKRSDQFGLAYLRLAKKLQEGFTLTVEPGIYFIPALIEKWRSEGKHRDFINYDKLEEYLDFGGIRIEDSVAVTEEGCRILGKPVPKEPEEVEALRG